MDESKRYYERTAATIDNDESYRYRTNSRALQPSLSTPNLLTMGTARPLRKLPWSQINFKESYSRKALKTTSRGDSGVSSSSSPQQSPARILHASPEANPRRPSEQLSEAINPRKITAGERKETHPEETRVRENSHLPEMILPLPSPKSQALRLSALPLHSKLLQPLFTAICVLRRVLRNAAKRTSLVLPTRIRPSLGY